MIFLDINVNENIIIFGQHTWADFIKDPSEARRNPISLKTYLFPIHKILHNHFDLEIDQNYIVRFSEQRTDDCHSS